jgi:hypothetical protein
MNKLFKAARFGVVIPLLDAVQFINDTILVCACAPLLAPTQVPKTPPVATNAASLFLRKASVGSDSGGVSVGIVAEIVVEITTLVFSSN